MRHVQLSHSEIAVPCICLHQNRMLESRFGLRSCQIPVLWVTFSNRTRQLLTAPRNEVSVLSPLIFWPCFAGLVILTIGFINVRKELSATLGLDKLIALGRVFFAAPLAVFGAEHFAVSRSIMQVVPPWVAGRLVWACFVGLCLIAAALSLVLTKYVRLSAPLLAIMFFLFAAMIHLPNVAANPKDRIVWAVAVRDLDPGSDEVRTAFSPALGDYVLLVRRNDTSAQRSRESERQNCLGRCGARSLVRRRCVRASCNRTRPWLQRAANVRASVYPRCRDLFRSGTFSAPGVRAWRSSSQGYTGLGPLSSPARISRGSHHAHRRSTHAGPQTYPSGRGMGRFAIYSTDFFPLSAHNDHGHQDSRISGRTELHLRHRS